MSDHLNNSEYMHAPGDLLTGLNTAQQKAVQISEGPGVLGGINPAVLVSFIISWIMVIAIIGSGVKGLGKVVIVTALLPVAILIILTLRGFTLEGALDGLNYYLKPDFSALTRVKVWMAAYSQVFYYYDGGETMHLAYTAVDQARIALWRGDYEGVRLWLDEVYRLLGQ